MTKGTEPHIALTVFKNSEPKSNYIMILQSCQRALLKIAKRKLQIAFTESKPLSSDLFSEELKRYDFGLSKIYNEVGISCTEFDSYRNNLKADLKKWIENGQAISELFVLLLLDNEQQGE